MKPDVAAPGLIHVSNNLKYSSILIKNFFIPRGVGTGETGEAHASPEIRGCLKSNRQEKKYVWYSIFFSASPEIILFLRPCIDRINYTFADLNL